MVYEPYRAPGETSFHPLAGYRATGSEVQGDTHYHADSTDYAIPCCD